MATTQLDDSHVSWDMASSMKMISGNPTEMNQQLPPDGKAPTALYDQMSKEELFKDCDRPVKRLRTRAHSASQFATALPLDDQVTPHMAKNLTTEETYEINGTQGDSSASGSGSTPADSSSTSLFSSFDNGKSTTPRTTPEQNTSSPSYTPGFSILNSGKVDPAKCKPRSSLPTGLPPTVYGYQCVTAAYASRLDPYKLHPKEQELLQDDLCHLHVTTYLNLRNSILRLWTRNAMVSVAREEALGCAKDYRWMNLASFAYDWLIRYGYINFGCVEVPVPPVTPRKGRRKEGPVIAVVGAGVGGLGCARQLEGLLTHYRDSETSPRVVVIEGRRRIGGRVYSHPLHSMKSDTLPEGLVPKAEMGAQIITGFDRGNPLDQIVRSQLALHYHHIHDMSTLYDIDGTPVNERRDMRNQQIYNDVLNRSEAYRHKLLVLTTAEGDRDSIDKARDVTGDDGLTIRQYEDALRTGTAHLLVPTKKVRRRRGAGHKSLEDSDLASGKIDDLSQEDPAAMAAAASGWKLKRGIKRKATVDLDKIAAASPNQTLGAVLDDGIKQYQRMLKMTSKDMRLFNWHFANLEYANAANVNLLSLAGWDQDTGNEFEGEHAQVIGGYQQLPYGLYSLPTKLDVRTNKIVQSISYDATGTGKKSVIQCEDGETFEADHIVFTGSLGVLKHRSIEFNPPLADWKTEAIDRLGFGVMNKLVLVFNEPFWDTERDMFGLLRDSTIPHSMSQEDYAQNRGQFYLFWNCMQSTGLPVLIALMAGDAALQAEKSTDKEIIDEAVSQLRNIFKHTRVPDPLETIVTRWAADKFTYGTYSYVAGDAMPNDYDLMAKPIGNLHFAGEATCGTHPATVHGAYISGLRAAAEVIESITGPMEVPLPLVLDKVASKVQTASPLATKPRPRRASATKRVPVAIKPTQSRKRPQPQARHPVTAAPTPTPPPAPQPLIDKHRRASYEKAMQEAITSQIGSAPARPQRLAPNPFLLYQKDFWSVCREQCDSNRRASSNNPKAKATRNEIRQALGQMWRNAPPEQKQPYLSKIEGFRAENAKNEGLWKKQLDEWNRLSVSVRERWCTENPLENWEPTVLETEGLIAL